MNLLKKQKKEAYKIIKVLTKKYNLNSEMIDDFKNSLIFMSDFTSYGLSKADWDYVSYLRRLFETKYNAFVYYVTVSQIEVEGMDCAVANLFYVSQFKDEWKRCLYPQNDEMYIYGYNLNILEYSEFGYIGIENIDGRLARKY